MSKSIQGTQIFKVQKSVFTSDGKGKWLLYNQMTTIMQEILDEDIADEIKKAMGGDLKMYANFKVDLSNNELTFVERVADQPW